MIILKNDEVIDFLTCPPTDFLALTMFKLQHHFSNIVETSRTTRLPEFRVTVND